MEGGWEERSCDSDTSPNFNLTAPRSQDETEAANMLSKDSLLLSVHESEIQLIRNILHNVVCVLQ